MVSRHLHISSKKNGITKSDKICWCFRQFSHWTFCWLVNMNIKGYEYICALVANAINSIFNNDILLPIKYKVTGRHVFHFKEQGHKKLFWYIPTFFVLVTKWVHLQDNCILYKPMLQLVPSHPFWQPPPGQVPLTWSHAWLLKQ